MVFVGFAFYLKNGKMPVSGIHLLLCFYVVVLCVYVCMCTYLLILSLYFISIHSLELSCILEAK